MSKPISPEEHREFFEKARQATARMHENPEHWAEELRLRREDEELLDDALEKDD